MIALDSYARPTYYTNTPTQVVPESYDIYVYVLYMYS